MLHANPSSPPPFCPLTLSFSPALHRPFLTAPLILPHLKMTICTALNRRTAREVSVAILFSLHAAYLAFCRCVGGDGGVGREEVFTPAPSSELSPQAAAALPLFFFPNRTETPDWLEGRSPRAPVNSSDLINH